MDGNTKKFLDCPFCHIYKSKHIKRNKYSFSVLDNYPVTKGHSLIISNTHTSNYFDLTKKEKFALFDLLEETKEYIIEKYKPSGFNIGININKSAGQTVAHVHIHLIPRYDNNFIDPTGGIRNIIPGKGKY